MGNDEADEPDLVADRDDRADAGGGHHEHLNAEPGGVHAQRQSSVVADRQRVQPSGVIGRGAVRHRARTWDDGVTRS